MIESFTIKAGNNRLNSIVGLKVIMDFNNYSVLRDGKKIGVVRFNEVWEQEDGNFTDEELEQIGDAIESHYM